VSIADQIKQLAALKDAGVLSEEQFDKAMERLLNPAGNGPEQGAAQAQGPVASQTPLEPSKAAQPAAPGANSSPLSAALSRVRSTKGLLAGLLLLALLLLYIDVVSRDPPVPDWDSVRDCANNESGCRQHCYQLAGAPRHRAPRPNDRGRGLSGGGVAEVRYVDVQCSLRCSQPADYCPGAYEAHFPQHKGSNASTTAKAGSREERVARARQAALTEQTSLECGDCACGTSKGKSWPMADFYSRQITGPYFEEASGVVEKRTGDVAVVRFSSCGKYIFGGVMVLDCGARDGGLRYLDDESFQMPEEGPIIEAAVKQFCNPDLLTAGQEALRAKDASKAVGLLKKCTDSNDRATECWWELGWAYWLLEDWADVVRCWEKVATLNPSRKGLNKWLASARDKQFQEEELDRMTESFEAYDQ